MMTAREFLVALDEECRVRGERAGLALAYERLHGWRREGDHATLDAVLAGCDERALTPRVLLGLLTVTCAPKAKLPARAEFLRRAVARLGAVWGVEAARAAVVGLE